MNGKKLGRPFGARDSVPRAKHRDGSGSTPQRSRSSLASDGSPRNRREVSVLVLISCCALGILMGEMRDA